MSLEGYRCWMGNPERDMRTFGSLLWRINSEVVFNGLKDGDAMDEK